MHVHVHCYMLHCLSITLLFFSWLKEFSISIASERKQRKLAKEILGTNLQMERCPFTFTSENGKGEEIREAPFVFTPNLVQRVADLLANNDRYV